jgi:hypothetical protein
MHYEYKMREGEKLNRNPNAPILSVVGDGPNTYLWVGNNADGDMACFATIGGSANLHKIAHSILKCLDGPARKTKG